MGTLRRPRGSRASLTGRSQPPGSARCGHRLLPTLGEPGLPGALQPQENTGAILVEGGGRTWVQISAALSCLLCSLRR